MNRPGLIVSISLTALMLTNCATIITGSEYPVAINSSPDQADFVITNRAGQRVHAGVTPDQVTLKSSSKYFQPEQYTVTVNKGGFAETTYNLQATLDGWYWGNLLLGGLIGMLVVDPITGAMYKLPERIDTSLSQSTAAVNSDSVVIATIDSLSENERSLLIPINFED